MKNSNIIKIKLYVVSAFLLLQLWAAAGFFD